MNKIKYKCTCCGKQDHEVDELRPQMSFNDDNQVIGYFFECTCDSTMFIKVSNEEIVRILSAKENKAA